MEKRYLVLALISVILIIISLSPLNSATIIVINETKEQLYALEKVTISGDLESNSLAINGNGEVIIGDNVKIYLFGPASDILLKNVKVNGQDTSISFDDNGYFFVAEKGKFYFNGNLEIRTIGQIRLSVRGPMNELTFDLQHGYAIGGNRYGLYNSEVIIQRAEKVSMLIDGSFRYSYAEKNQFYYGIKFKAFGSSLGSYTLNLYNNEVVTSVTGVLKWEQKDDNLILDLESSEANVIITGLFNSFNLRIPLEENRHHVVIESDPEKKISIQTTADEIDISQSTIRPTYSNARAFLASNKDFFKIEVKQLNVLPSLAASVSSSTNKIAITPKGSILGEMIYSYKNTGVDYIEVDIGKEAKPLYASTERAPVKLTAEEKLLLSFPKTQYGTLDLVYFTTRSPIKPIDLINIPLAKTELPITTATTQIYISSDYFVLETFGADGGSELPTFKTVLLFIIVICIISYFLMKDTEFIFSYLIFGLGLFYFDVGLFLLMIAITLILIVKKHMEGKSLKIILLGGIVFIVIILFIFAILFIFVWQLGIFNMGGTTMTTSVSKYADVERAQVPEFKSMETLGEGEGAITVPTRTGVYPVKLELPNLGKMITVKTHLVTKENQPELKVLVIATWFKYILYLVSLVFGISSYRIYGGKTVQ